MGMQARRTLNSMGIPDTDLRWEHVKYRSSSSNPITKSNNRAQQTAREPSPFPPPTKSRPKAKPAPPPPRSVASLADSPPAVQIAKNSHKVSAPKRVDRVKAPPTARHTDSGTHSNEPIRPYPVSRINGKRGRDHDLEDDLLGYSETKKRKSSDEDSSTPLKAVSKPTNGIRGSLQAASSSKLLTQTTPPSSSKLIKLNGSASSKRRKSPIYTSTSESEESEEPIVVKHQGTNGTGPHRPPKKTPSPLPPNGRPRTLSYTMPKIAFGGALPKDHASLRKRYNAIYPSYIAVYQKRAEQRLVIEKILEDSLSAEEGEVDGGLAMGSDIEMMDASDLERMNSDLNKLENELSRINAALQSAPS